MKKENKSVVVIFTLNISGKCHPVPEGLLESKLRLKGSEEQVISIVNAIKEKKG